ncbi:MAG: hypothetical protein O210_OD1C00001G0593 [Parcubacteria bacterium RAAC4_OD1_1]|nr:MAG: hypothetical protein O210_OD1C00001G0593 [Parcubacteria bacterium RAAC4_OD1_1]
MVNSKTNKKSMSVGKAIGVGASVAALSAAAYLLFGPEGKKNRKIIKGWSVKMKGEIIEKLEKAKDVTEPIYHKVVDEISSKYKKMKNIDPKELEEVIGEIKKHWKGMIKGSKPKAKKK